MLHLKTTRLVIPEEMPEEIWQSTADSFSATYITFRRHFLLTTEQPVYHNDMQVPQHTLNCRAVEEHQQLLVKVVPRDVNGFHSVSPEVDNKLLSFGFRGVGRSAVMCVHSVRLGRAEGVLKPMRPVFTVQEQFNRKPLIQAQVVVGKCRFNSFPTTLSGMMAMASTIDLFGL